MDSMIDGPNGYNAPRLGLSELEAAAKYAAKASWPQGFALYQRGAPADGIFIVLRGRIVLRSRVKAGRGFVPVVAARGETFGAEGLGRGGTYVTDARAEEPSETLHLSGIRFRAFVREQPQQALGLIGQVMAEHAALLEKLRELATLSVEQRLVSTLLRMAHQQTFTAADGRITLDAGQYRLLCEMVGATRESVSLVLARLAADGMVERRGTNYVIAPAAELVERLGQQWRDTEVSVVTGRDVGDAGLAM